MKTAMSYFINKGTHGCSQYFINALGEGDNVLHFKDLCSFHWEVPTNTFSASLLELVMFVVPFYTSRNQRVY